MKIRFDSVFLSSVLFTIALVCLVPMFSRNVLTQHDIRVIAKLGDGYLATARAMSDLALASLAMILVALIVVWTGYRERTRWAWFVLCAVVWAWAFPLLMSLFRGRIDLSFPEWLYNAITYPGLPRISAQFCLLFLLMVIALALSMKSFFFNEPAIRLTTRLLSLSAIGIAVGIAALFTWIRVGVLYQIPSAELNLTQRLPPPIAPPGWNN